MNSTEYVGRAAFKLEASCIKFKIDFRGKTVLDIGSSTGGFSDYALQNGAERVIAIERGSRQMASPLRFDKRIELHEKTDILSVEPFGSKSGFTKLALVPDIVLIDLSFVSLKSILAHVSKLVDSKTQLVVLVKPQFEAGNEDKNKGIIKNENIRRRIFKDFELWVRKYFVVLNKVDSALSGTKGNKERFYLLRKNISS
ncbi:MAG TPA: SAM-dependent methyltransferase [Candidatus Saccharimonadales bacterium]